MIDVPLHTPIGRESELALVTAATRCMHSCALVGTGQRNFATYCVFKFTYNRAGVATDAERFQVGFCPVSSNKTEVSGGRWQVAAPVPGRGKQIKRALVSGASRTIV